MAFLGIKIPVQTARLLADLDVPGKRTGVHEMHITILMFEDNWAIEKVADALETAYDIIAKTEPFTIKTKKVSSFPAKEGKPHPVIAMVESKELHELSKKLRRKFNKEEIEFDKTFKDYNPHITLAYADEAVKDFKIDCVEVVVQELVLFGGDHGDSRICVTFPLKSPEKHGALLRKCEMFEKLAGNGLTDPLTPAEYETRLRELISNIGEPEPVFKFIEDNYEIIKKKKRTDLIYLARTVKRYFMRANPGAFYEWVTSLSRIDPEFTLIVRGMVVQEINVERERLSNDTGRWADFINYDFLPLEGFLTHEQAREIFKQFLENVALETQHSEILLSRFLMSKKIDKKLVLRLMRQIHPKMFAKKYEPQDGRGIPFFEMDRYGTDDIIHLLEEYTAFRYKDLRHIIDYATPQAKDILRRVLWWSRQGNFILDETFQPVGFEETGEFTQRVMKIAPNDDVGAERGDTRKEWWDLFNEYGIVPYPGTFAAEK